MKSKRKFAGPAETTQVLVVGGGPVGLCAALCAARRGLTVTVFEQNFRGYARGHATLGVQWSFVSRQFTDANNTVSSPDADVGIVPAYQIVDLSAKWQLNRMIGLDLGVNNLANLSYFTMRTSEYPGPGIIPGIGRSLYLGVRAGF